MSGTDNKSIEDQINFLMISNEHDMFDNGYNNAIIEAAEIAAEGEAALRAEVEALRKEVREAAMESLADLGQAQEALERAMKAEADRDRLAADLEKLCDWVENECGCDLPFDARVALARITKDD